MNNADQKHAADEKAIRIAKVAFSGSMALFLAVALFTGYSIFSYLRASEAVRTATQHDAELDRLVAALKDVQRGVRGYLIAGDPAFLAPYETGRINAAHSIDDLRESLKDSPDKGFEFEGTVVLVDTLLGELTREVEYARRGAFEDALAIVRTGRSKQAMDSISSVLTRLTQDETVQAESQSLRAENNLSRALMLLVVGGGCNFIVLIVIFVAVQRQLRERVRLSDILEKSERRLDLIIKSIQEGLTVSASDGAFEIFNPRMCEITGYSREEANGSAPFRAQLNASAAHSTEASGPFAFETEIETRDGGRRILRGCSRRLEQAGARMLLTTYQDVTEERKAQEELRVQRAYFERLFESLPEGVALIDERQTIRNVNPAYVNMFGFSRSDVLNQDFTTLTVPGEMANESRDKLARVLAGEVMSFETRRKKKDGTMIDVSIIATPVDLGTGQRMSYGIYRDITERKQAEAEQERLIGELLQALAEVKTLSGLLPICAWCKKVRDDKGYYHQIEAYITHHSGAKFTHGICPDCAKKFNSELALSST